jgi:uncharacterized membrane protein YfcA
LIAEIIGTMAGFGLSTIFLPLDLLFVDFKTTIILVAIFHLFGNHLYIPLLFGIVLIGSFIGRRIVGRINQELFRKMVLIVIVLVSIKFIVDGLLM